MCYLVLSMEIFNALFYIMSAWQIYRICRQNPRRIKTVKFDEDDYLINGILFGAIANDIGFNYRHFAKGPL